MSDSQAEVIIAKLFKLIRREFNLGMREYLAAFEAVRGGFVDFGTVDDTQDLLPLRSTLELLWCHSRQQLERFGELWERIEPTSLRVHPVDTKALPGEIQLVEPIRNPSQFSAHTNPQPLPVQTKLEPKTDFNLAPLPVRAPVTLLEMDTNPDLEAYWPVSRRSMRYFWRYLRRPRSDGPMDVMDLRSTVEQAAKKGVFLGPVFQRRSVNHAHLVLFLDQEGSMMPLHRFTRDVVETAQEDSTLEHLEIYYFYNVPGTHVYEDAALAKPIPLSKALMQCDTDTSVLIVSDAGAARGQRQMRRFRETTLFLLQLKQRTNLIGWLNPLPRDRWSNTTANLISRLVPMAQMDDDGFSNLIDIVRGQSMSGWQTGGDT
jgi:uncharacterized protein